MMKQILIILYVLSLSTFGYNQNSFKLQSRFGDQKVLINGAIYKVDSVNISIPTNYPEFDTLTFLTEPHKPSFPIICNFKPDTTYSISMACCGSCDIIPISKFNNDSLKYWDYEEDFKKIQNQFWDKPFISIKSKEILRLHDTIYAWHSDAACETDCKSIGIDLWELGVPPKCYYWNNITFVVFFKKSINNETIQAKQIAEFLNFDKIEIITEISFRLFDNERFVLIYDDEKETVKIEYEQKR